MRIVSAPAQQVEAVETSIGGLVDEFTGFHHDYVSINAQVFLELGLELNSNQTGFGQVAAEDVAVVDGGLETFRETCISKHRFGCSGIEFVPRFTGTSIGDAARGEVGSDFRTLGVEVIHDALAVDAHRNRLAHFHIVERLERVGHRQVEDVGAGDRQQLQVRVIFNGLDVIGADVGDVIDRAGLQFEQTCRTFGRPTEDQGFVLGFRVPSSRQSV